MPNMNLDHFETLLARYTAKDTREVHGAIGLAVDREGTVVYHHAGGFQSLDEDAKSLDRESVFELGSAGKLFLHIAALQCVERGLIGLDEPVGKYMPELASAQIVVRNNDSATDGKAILTLQDSPKSITLRHLLTHTSGIGSSYDPLVAEWEAQKTASSDEKSDPAPVLLLFVPGEEWNYGDSISWIGKLVAKLTGQTVIEYVDTNVFKPLGMNSSTFYSLDQSGCPPELHERRLPLVIRQAGSEESKTKLILPKRAPPLAPATTASDYGKLLTALMTASTQGSILSQESIDLLFTGHLSGKPLADLRADKETYAAPAGLPATVKEPKVNFTAAGALLIEEEMPLSGFPAQTLTWNGMPNVIWSVNRKVGKAAVFATQLIPVDDEAAVEVAMSFLKGVWGV